MGSFILFLYIEFLCIIIDGLIKTYLYKQEKEANKDEEAIAKKTDAEVEDQPLIEEEDSSPDNDEEVSQGEEEFSESNAKPEADEPVSDNQVNSSSSSSIKYDLRVITWMFRQFQQQGDSAGEPDAIDAPSDMPRKRKPRKE